MCYHNELKGGPYGQGRQQDCRPVLRCSSLPEDGGGVQGVLRRRMHDQGASGPLTAS